MMKKNITIITISILILIGIYWLFLSPEKERLIKVSGVVIDPSTSIPVSDVDLSVGDTDIQTGESGRFVFTNVSSKEGIKLTHPEILRAIVKLPEGQSNIFFNASMYNTLIVIIDREARGNLDFIYDQLDLKIKEKVTREFFRDEYKSIFGNIDITNQEIVIRDMYITPDYYNKHLDLRFSDIILFEVVNDENTKWYSLIHTEDDVGFNWKLIY
jgi:hypothetical protein